MEQDAVRMNFEVGQTALAEVAAKLCFVRAVDFLDMQDEFVQLVRVVVDLAQFDLPGADLRSVIEDVLELVEIHESSLDLIEGHRLDLRAPGNVPEKTWNSPAAVRAGLVRQSTVNVIASPVT